MGNKFANFLKEYEEDFIKAGKELDKEKMPQLTEELFSVYERTSNRLEYEKVYFKRRKFLTVYAMLSILFGDPRDISRLEEVIEAISAEECWALRLHRSSSYLADEKGHEKA